MRQWKVGRITLGLFLIIMGVVLVLNSITSIPIDRILSFGWPVLLIVLGIEILVHQLLRKNNDWSFDVFSIFLIFIAGVSMLVIFTVQSVGVIPMIKESLLAQQYSIDINESKVVNDTIREVEIDIDNASIELFGTANNQLQISGEIHASYESVESAEKYVEEAFKIKEVGNKIVITMEKSNNRPAWIPGNEATLAIEIPKQLQATINVKNGKVIAKDLAQGVNIDGKNLAIELAEITGAVKIKNTNGNIEMRNIEGYIDTILTNGNINVSSVTIIDDCKLETVNGNITIEIADNNHLNIVASTTNGRVIQDIANTEDKDNNFNHVIGDGKHRVELKSVNGNIRLD